MTRIATAVLALILSLPAYCWNDLGHMTVAAIAYDKLTPEKRERVKELLKLNPDYQGWLKDPGKMDPDKLAFMRAATWADAIRGFYTNDGFKPSQSDDPFPNTGYKDRRVHSYWHFRDKPFAIDGAKGTASDQPNAQTQIAAFRKALAAEKGEVSEDIKSYDLVWLLHLVGDVHQPLHAISRFTPKQQHGDTGGNGVKLCAKLCDFSLHKFWDRALGTSESPELAQTLQGKILGAPNVKAVLAKQGAISSEATWLEESFNSAKKFAYAEPVGPDSGPYTLNDTYRLKAGSEAEKRIALAGQRLANLLNQELK